MNRITVLLLILATSFTSFAQQTRTYDWLLVYYMPYDNDLSPLARTIINQVLKEKSNGRVCIALQTDLAGPGGTMRYIINESIDSTNIADENSADATSFQDFLHWAYGKYKAKHYAVVLLNHGGRLNEYGVDKYPSKKWMRI